MSVLLLAILTGILPAQNTFEFVLEYPVRKLSTMAIERENGEVVALVSERTNVEYAPSSPSSAYLLSFSPQGDTLTYHYSFGDTLFNFSLIERLSDGGYIVAGEAFPSDSDHLYLLLVKLDENLNKVWTKYHDMEGSIYVSVRRLFEINNRYLMAIEHCVFPCSSICHQLSWFDTSGNIKNSYLHNKRSRGSSDYLLNNDSTRVWAFSPGLTGGGGTGVRLTFDMSPQFIEQSILPISGGGYSNVKWHRDSSFLYSCYYLRPDYAGPNDQDVWLVAYDSLLNVLNSNYFGSYQTQDVAGIFRDIDFIHPDTVYFAGFKDQNIGKPHLGRVNWIMTGQTDAHLQPRYLHFIGGDHYYETWYILATRDGGSFICASRFNHATQVYDPVFLKLNNLGLLTGKGSLTIPVKKTAFWPIPFTDRIHYRTTNEKPLLKLFDVAGHEMFEMYLQNSTGTILFGEIPPGVYMYMLHYENGAVENGKLVKSF